MQSQITFTLSDASNINTCSEGNIIYLYLIVLFVAWAIGSIDSSSSRRNFALKDIDENRLVSHQRTLCLLVDPDNESKWNRTINSKHYASKGR